MNQEETSVNVFGGAEGVGTIEVELSASAKL